MRSNAARAKKPAGVESGGLKSLREAAKRGRDLNPRPPGYEPDKLTRLLYPAAILISINMDAVN